MKKMNQKCNATKTMLGRSNSKHTIKHNKKNRKKREGKYTKGREGRRKMGRASKAWRCKWELYKLLEEA